MTQNRLKGVKKSSYHHVENDNNHVLYGYNDGYKIRVFIYACFLIVFLILGFICLFNIGEISKENNIIYSSNSSSYNVSYQDNNYIKNTENYEYNTINNIDFNFNYSLNLDEEVEGTFNYIIGYTYLSHNDTEVLYEENKELYSSSLKTLKNTKSIDVYETVNLDYSHLEELVNKYANNSNAVLYVDLIIKTDKEYKLRINQFNIMFKDNEIVINNSNEVTHTMSIAPTINITSKRYIVLTFASFLGCFLIIIRMSELLLLSIKSNDNAYDTLLKKILTTYDLIIVNTKTPVTLSGYTIYKITDFGELVDAHNNLRKPIMFYEVSSHNKCEFFIQDHEIIYLYTLKEADLEKSE